MKKALVFLLSQLVAAALTAQVNPNATVEQDAAQFLIPIAGNVAGAKGEHFRTDLTIVNYRRTEQLVDVTFVPQIGPPVGTRLRIPFLTNITYTDIVLQKLETTGLGALVVTAIHEDGSFDPGAVLDGNARIWTRSAAQTGEISAYVAGTTLHGWRNDSPAYVHGMKKTSQHRISYGIVNLDLSRTRTFRVIVNGSLSRYEQTVEVRPFSMAQVPVTRSYGDLSIYVEPLGEGGPWRAYATATDNESRSFWVVPAMQPARDVVYP